MVVLVKLSILALRCALTIGSGWEWELVLKGSERQAEAFVQFPTVW